MSMRRCAGEIGGCSANVPSTRNCTASCQLFGSIGRDRVIGSVTYISVAL
jgi:hypothetical protein